jgi:hypothetical protein
MNNETSVHSQIANIATALIVDYLLAGVHF